MDRLAKEGLQIISDVGSAARNRGTKVFTPDPEEA